MSVMHPLATVNVASITILVRMTLYHHAISVYRTKVETNEDMVVLGGKVPNAAAENPVTQLVSDIPGVRSEKKQMTMEGARAGRLVDHWRHVTEASAGGELITDCKEDT